MDLGSHPAHSRGQCGARNGQKLCARVAQAVLLTYERTRTRMPGKAPQHVVGVPVNPKVLAGDRAEAAARYGLDPARPVVLLVGGSLGAARINELAIALGGRLRAFQILHLCGPKYEESVRSELPELPADYVLVPYEDRMADAYAVADLIVARAGSSTLAEITAVGKPSLLIPSPNVTENHQEGNARGLEEAGAAQVQVEKDWDIHAVVDRVDALISNAEGLETMAAAALTQARLDAADRAADVVEALLRAR